MEEEKKGKQVRKPVLQWGLLLIFYLVLPLINYWRLWFGLPAERTLLALGDLYHVHWPNLSMAFAALRAGELPLWNPYLGGGFPLVAAPHLGIYYPPHWLYGLYELVGGPSFRAFQYVSSSLGLSLAGIWMHLYLRQQGLKHRSALVGGLALMAAGFASFYFDHRLLHSILWTPLLFWAVERLVEAPSWRRAVLAGFALAMAGLVGSLSGLFYVLLMAFSYLAFLLVPRWIGKEKESPRRLVPSLVLMGVVALALLAVILLPLVPYASELLVSHSPHRSNNMPYRLMGLVLPYFGVGYYHGIVVLLLAVLAFVWPPRRGKLFLFLGFVLLGLGLSLYQNYLTVDPARYWPGSGVFAWKRILCFTSVGLAVLAAYGLEGLLRLSCDPTTDTGQGPGSREGPTEEGAGGGRATGDPIHHMTLSTPDAGGDESSEEKQTSPTEGGGDSSLREGVLRFLVRVWIFFAGLTFVTILFSASMRVSYWRYGNPLVMLVLFLGLAILLLHRLQEKPRWIWMTAFVLVLVLDLFHHSKGRFQMSHSLFRRHQPRVMQKLPRGPLSPWRVMNNYDYGPRHVANLYQIRDFMKPMRLQLKRQEKVLRRVRLRPALLRYFNVRRVLLAQGRHPSSRHVLIHPRRFSRRNWSLKRHKGVAEYRYKPARAVAPRVYWVPSWRVVPSGKEALARLGRFAPLREAVLERADLVRWGNPRLVSSPAREGVRGRVIQAGFNFLKAEITAPAAGLVVLNELYDRRWKARLNGRPVPLYRANYLLRAIAVPQGRHTITLHYRPWSYFAGFLLWLGCWGLGGAALVSGWRQRRRKAKSKEER